MKSGKSKIRKFMALAVCAALIGGSLSGVAFAEVGDGTDTADIVKETVSGEESSVNEGSSATVESSGNAQTKTSHKAVETASNAANPEDEEYIVETLSNAIKPLADGDVAKIGSTTYATVQAAVDAAGSGDTITMIADSEENVTVSSGKNITLDLAGCTLDGGQNGSVITNNGTLTLEDSSGNDSGRITNGNAKYGGGIYNTGTLTMNGGTITENKANVDNYSEGAGVYNDAGTFIMNGGAINGNTAYYQAGGVENYTNATFIMYGGQINENKITSEYGHGGGIYCYNGTVTIYDGEICNNEANYGGGINCGGSTSSNLGVLNIYGGTISGNSAIKDGGGVQINGAGGVLNIYGGEITENSSKRGGGVWSCGEVLLKDCEISGNTAETSGAGFYGTDGPGVYRYIHLEGNVYIDGNHLDTGETSNFFMEKTCNYLILNEDLGAGSSIGISRENAVPGENNRVQITSAETDTEYYKTSAQYFYYDGDSSYRGVANDKEHYVDLGMPFKASLDQDGTTTYYDSVQAAINAAGSTGGTVMMWDDLTENVTVADGQNITLDLNGYTLSGNGTTSVVTIDSGAEMTLTDSGDGGCITGGNADNGGGINNSGTLTIDGGTISGNTAGNGGGIYNASVFNMTGGTVSGNTADNGGGICTSGTLSMSGGSIYGNTADTAAADICAVSGSSLNLIAASEMEADEYTFTGWYNDPAGARYADTDNPEECDTGSAGDHYVIAAYGSTVTYSVDGDTSMIEAAFIDITKGQTEVTLASGDEITVPVAYCYFDNWNTAEDGSGTTYAGGAAYSGESVTLYAQFADHTWNEGEVTKEPTCTDAGVTTYTCTRCGATKTEEIKALGHDWKVDQTINEYFEDYYEEHIIIKCSRCGLEYEQTITVSTESESGDTSDSDLSWSDLITTDELADLLESGAELDFTLTTGTIPDSDVPSADKDLVDDLIASQWPDSDYTASWQDINAQVDILYPDGTEETRTFTEALNPISVTVDIPKELINADGDSYVVIRICDGEASVIDSTVNRDGTITFETDLSSNYVIVKTGSGTSGGGTSGGGSSSHSDNDDDDDYNTSSSVESPEGHSYAYVKGTWTIDEYGYWRFTSDAGKRYENEWGYIYNPYADVSAGQPEASWFHFGDDGIMDTGWYTDADGYIYYLNPEIDNTQGRMFTGWNWIKAGDGRNLCYYFDETPASGHYGRLFISTTTPDGYTVDETGAWTENGEQVTK